MSNIKITPDDIRKQMKNGRNEKSENNGMTLDDLRRKDMEDVMLEKIQNRGKMTLQDMMMYDWWQRKQDNEGGSRSNDNVEEIIRKSQEPLLRRIEEMEREREREKEKEENERRYKVMENSIQDLKAMLTTGNKKDDENPVIKKIEALEEELRDEKEKGRKKDEDNYRKHMEDMIYSLSDRMEELNKIPNKSDNTIQKIIEMDKQKKELLQALGVSNKKEGEEASTMDYIDTLLDRAPKVAKTVSTVREIFSKDNEIPDDVPEDVPYQLPQRDVPRAPLHTQIPADIKEFLDSGGEKNGQFVDNTGAGWIDRDGKPLSRKDIEETAITNPDTVRWIMQTPPTNNAHEQEGKKKEIKHTEKPHNDTDVEIHSSASVPAEPEKELEETPEENKEPVDEELNTALEYIGTGQDRKDDAGNMVWVGKLNEIYSTDDGKPATKEALIKMAREDPEGFNATTREHIEKLSENNGE